MSVRERPNQMIIVICIIHILTVEERLQTIPALEFKLFAYLPIWKATLAGPCITELEWNNEGNTWMEFTRACGYAMPPIELKVCVESHQEAIRRIMTHLQLTRYPFSSNPFGRFPSFDPERDTIVIRN